MRKKSSLKKKFIISVSVVMLLVAMAAATVFADAETGVTLLGGSTSGGTITFASFADITLNGQQQQTAPVTWSIAGITDARGTGSGWTLSLSLSQLSEYAAGAYVPSGKTLPLNSITMASALSVGEADLSSSPASDLAAAGAGAFLDTGLSVDLLTADPGEGMGSYDAIWGVRLTVPASAYARTYKSNAVLTMTLGTP